MHSKNNNQNDLVITRDDWDRQALVLQSEFTQLRHEDLHFEVGKEDDLLRRLENRLNKNRDEVIALIKKVQSVKEEEIQNRKRGPAYGRNL